MWASDDMGQVVGQGVRFAFAAPVGLEGPEVAASDAAVERGEAVANVLIGIELLELEAERFAIVLAGGSAGDDVNDLRQVIVGEDEFVGGPGGDYVHEVP